MSETREETQDLDCPQCGAGVPAMRWHEADDDDPRDEWLAWEDEEFTCPECRALLRVTVYDEYADLALICCRHGRSEDESCWRCDVRKWPSRIRSWVRRTWRRGVCVVAGHAWRDCDSTGAPWMKEWEACSRCIKVRRKDVTP